MMLVDDEYAKLKDFAAFIDKRLAEGASEQELDKLYDDMHSLQQNYYLGMLLGDDNE